MARTEITSCADALRLLAAHLDGELDEHQHGEVDKHINRCRSCFSRAEFERGLKSSVAELGREPVPPEVDQRIKTLVRQFTVAGQRNNQEGE
jgi:anti-sigma factor (TIGR02949 family)